MKEYTNSEIGFFEDSKKIINEVRGNAVRSVDFCRVLMYWKLGQRIFEEEQQGKEKAGYGTYLIAGLQKFSNRSMAADFRRGSSNSADSFIGFIQLRTRCVRNSIGLNTEP